MIKSQVWLPKRTGSDIIALVKELNILLEGDYFTVTLGIIRQSPKGQITYGWNLVPTKWATNHDNTYFDWCDDYGDGLIPKKEMKLYLQGLVNGVRKVKEISKKADSFDD